MHRGETSFAEPLERIDPQTGRRILQLTSGPADDYPLYYYIPTLTRDGRSLVFHRLCDGQVQYHRLDLDSRRLVCLTEARNDDALWRPWLQPRARGVREYLGALNPQTDELLYFDGNDLRGVHVLTLNDRLIAQVPPGRVPCGLTGVSPDGRHFVYPHADQTWWNAHRSSGPPRHSPRPVAIECLDLHTGQSRSLLHVNFWITHTSFYDDRRILFCHPPTEQGILMTDLDGQRYTCLRTPSAANEQTCHYHATQRGIMYEFNRYADHVSRDEGALGLYNPDTQQRQEFALNARITHIGWDPQGLLWFGEQLREKPTFGRVLGYCPRLSPHSRAAFVPLTEPLQTCGDQRLQRTHTHAVLMPDRRSILFTGGDPRTNSNHPCLLDIADIETRTHIESVQAVSGT